MAEAALFGIAKSVLKQLASPALDEFRLLWGHKDQFEKLENTVTTIQNVLQDADRRQSSDATVQGWLARLRVVLYDADDFFDVISAKLLLDNANKGNKIGRKVRHFTSKPYRFAFLVKNVHKVKKLRERFDDIARDINGFKFLPNQPDLDVTFSRIGREQTHSYVRIDEVIGREQETEDIVSLLLPYRSKEQRGVSVIAVIGIGGLGKTTVAKLVYNDVRVQQGFDMRMWACINYFSNLKQVLITLLKSATMEVPKDLDLDQLQILFRQEIEGKRFLLVLDDVWDEDAQKWRDLKDLLSSGKEGSMVLTTTRSKVVAQRSCAIEPHFYLQGLSDENAWLLFKKIALEDEEERNNPRVEHLRQLIKRKCANVPLAIVTIASLLREKDKETWLHVNAELSELIPNDYNNDNIMQVLKFSYKELPYPVKRCFGYCSLFPKDDIFQKDSLIHLWIAQGFVDPLKNQSLEDRGEEYFLYLVDRCFFHLTGRDATTYQMHDLIHDLAIEVAGSENILFDHTYMGSWDKTVRHVSTNVKLDSYIVDRVCSFPHLKSLRTFLDSPYGWGDINVDKLMPSFKSLRVLVLWRIRKVPASIGELIHLRYLDISHMKRLPSSIFHLCHLQYLILQEHYDHWVVELPEDLGKLTQLRYLYLSYKHLRRLPTSICRLLNLESLILRGSKCLKELPEELGELTQLRYLDLSENNEMERLPSSIIGRLLHLESLILNWCERLEELPEELGLLQRLRHLDLYGCDNLVISMSTLASLVNLDKLVLNIPSGALNYLEKFGHLPKSLQIVLPIIESENSEMDAAERSFMSRESRLRQSATFCEIILDTDETEINSFWRQSEFRDLMSSPMNSSWSERRQLCGLDLFLEPVKAKKEVNDRQLPPNVAYLNIFYFGGIEMPHWVSSLGKLVFLRLGGGFFERCVKLPPLSDLPSLQELEICGMPSLLSIEDINFYKPNSFFLSLQTLLIRNMPNLKSWWLQPPTVLPTFPRLTNLSICDCPNLTRCLPLFPLVEDLELKEVQEEFIWQIIGSEVTSIGTSHGNSVLKKLKISDIGYLRSIAEAQISHLCALQYLIIEGCHQLESVVVNGLERLEIKNCDKINWDGMEALLSVIMCLELPTMNQNLFKRLKDMASLEELTIADNFNEELQEEEEEEEAGLPWKHLQKLHKVRLVFGDGFKMRNNPRLLHGFQHLTSLYQLELSRCKESYLPWRALVGLPNLQYVRIFYVEEVIDVDLDVTMIQTQPICRSSMELSITGGSREWVHDIPWKSLPFLATLRLQRLSNLKSLPEGIQHLAALTDLNIIDIPSVASLPDWMKSLSSLTHLTIRGISSELKKRCDEATGEDWPKILHIPHIDISSW